MAFEFFAGNLNLLTAIKNLDLSKTSDLNPQFHIFFQNLPFLSNLEVLNMNCIYKNYNIYNVNRL